MQRRHVLRRAILNILALILIPVIGVIVLNIVDPGWWPKFLGHAFPCQTPITYSLGTVDGQFKISQKDLLAAIAQAEGIWEKAAGKQLFTYQATGGALTINLVYDERQAATDKLKALGIQVNDDEASYKKLKADYDAWQAQYVKQKAAYDAENAALKKDQAAYEAEVQAANARGGATESEFNHLEQERQALNARVDQVNADANALNKLADQINSLVTVLNRLATTLNQATVQYNSAGSSIAKGFEEGVYESGPNLNEIDIYQFQDRDKLVRVLAHELGHALGLPHVDDPNAIMYKLNESKNETPTSADVSALKTLCHLP